jgi:hypothetical protein
MKSNLQITLNAITASICSEFNRTVKVYGEAVKSLSEGVAANYITVDNYQNCSVDDSYPATIFYVRNSASPTNESGQGMRKVINRTVEFTLVCNSERILDEYRIAAALNLLPLVTYNGSNYDQDTIAKNYFGIDQRNTISSFFTISFTVTERIECKVC